LTKLSPHQKNDLNTGAISDLVRTSRVVWSVTFDVVLT